MIEPAFETLAATQAVRAPDGSKLELTRCPIRVDGRILTSDRAAPRLGADTDAIMAEFEDAPR
jgi:crotonobetainyl-CoA:carnitine CoA-transferase CaiB-like acyl-CoA transferase